MRNSRPSVPFVAPTLRAFPHLLPRLRVAKSTALLHCFPDLVGKFPTANEAAINFRLDSDGLVLDRVLAGDLGTICFEAVTATGVVPLQIAFLALEIIADPLQGLRHVPNWNFELFTVIHRT